MTEIHMMLTGTYRMMNVLHMILTLKVLRHEQAESIRYKDMAAYNKNRQRANLRRAF